MAAGEQDTPESNGRDNRIPYHAYCKRSLLGKCIPGVSVESTEPLEHC